MRSPSKSAGSETFSSILTLSASDLQVRNQGTRGEDGLIKEFERFVRKLVADDRYVT